MSDIHPVYRILLDSKNLAADDLILSSLAELESDYKIQAIDVLLDRGQPDTLKSLMGHFAGFSESCRSHIAQRLDVMESVLREAIQSSEEALRLNVIDMINQSGGYSLCYILVEGLHSASAATRGRAAAAIKEMTQKYFQNTASGESAIHGASLVHRYQQFLDRDKNLTHLTTAIRQAIQAYGVHTRPTIIDAMAMMSLHLEADILSQSSQPSNRAWRATLDKFRHETHPNLAPLALQVIQSKDARVTISHLLSNNTNNEFMKAVLNECWLLGDSKVSLGVRSIKQLLWIAQNPQGLLALSPMQFRQAIRLLRHSCVEEQQQIEWFRLVLLSDQKQLQPLALQALIDIRHESSSEVLRLILDWADENLVAYATRELSRRYPNQEIRPPGRSQSATMNAAPLKTISPSASSATHAPTSSGVNTRRYLDAFDRLNPSDQVRVGLELMRNLPAFQSELALELRHRDAKNRMRAVQVITVLGLVQRFHEELFRCAKDSDRMVRSIAVKALAQISTGTAQKVLTNALNDPDRRVQANAIEALDQLGVTGQIPAIKEKLKDPDNRVRANAIHALLKLRTREAAAALIDLMQNPSRAHRMSALWIIEKLGLFALLEKVTLAAEQDPDEKIRRRARRIIHQARRDRAFRQTPVPVPQEEHRV